MLLSCLIFLLIFRFKVRNADEVMVKLIVIIKSIVIIIVITVIIEYYPFLKQELYFW